MNVVVAVACGGVLRRSGVELGGNGFCMVGRDGGGC